MSSDYFRVKVDWQKTKYSFIDCKINWFEPKHPSFHYTKLYGTKQLLNDKKTRQTPLFVVSDFFVEIDWSSLSWIFSSISSDKKDNNVSSILSMQNFPFYCRIKFLGWGREERISMQSYLKMTRRSKSKREKEEDPN